MSEWYVLEEISDRDVQYGSDAQIFPTGTIVRVLDRHNKHIPNKNNHFNGVTLEAHPELNNLNDSYMYMRFYFSVRLRPLDDLEVFRLLVERSKQDETQNPTANPTEQVAGVK